MLLACVDRDPPYYPTGVVASPDGNLYVLEVGFTLPSSWSGPRVRKLTADEKNVVVSTVGMRGAGGGMKAALAKTARASVEAAGRFFYLNGRNVSMITVFTLSFIGLLMAWKTHQGRRRA